jgi:hypothetical protein
MTTSLSVDQVKATLAAETSSLWDAVLASRGMTIGGNPPQADADLWSETLQHRGFAVGA